MATVANPICLSPLKFYESASWQNHKRSYAYGHISPLITQKGYIQPFQFVIPAGDNVSIQVFLCNVDGQVITELQTPEVYVENIGGYNLVISKGIHLLTQFEGEYYIKIKCQYTKQREAKILYWQTKIAAVEELFICFRGINSSEIQNFGIVVTTEDGTQISCPRSTAYDDYYNDDYPCMAGIYYNPQNPSLNHGRIIGIEVNNIEVDGIERVDSWRNASTAGATDQAPYYHLDIDAPEAETITYTEEIDYYSEVLCFKAITPEMDDYMRIVYKNSTGNFMLKNGIVSFDNNFEFELYIIAELGKPNYNFEEELTKRLGYNFIESQVSKKVYRFNTVVPEYICDALRIIRLCDSKKLTYKGQEYDMLSFDMDVDWQTQGDLASVTCEFEVDNVIVNLGGFIPQTE